MKPQNIIIALFFLLVISAFSFNFEEITGNPIKLVPPELGITNDVVKAGQPIQIKVKINDFCIDPDIEFYFEGLRKDTRTYHPTEDDCQGQNFYPCKGSKYCKGDLIDDEATMTYYTLPSWKVNPGLYTVRLHYIEKPGQKKHLEPYIEKKFKIIS
ncbi:MAG: hypothetical protein CMH62_02060 [Nanoarchaeota archaeon]|nr:hypothetical protein [Nanoarchaeota archaeon]|tara:strand:- start:917 stop:1384 length:468 start_codon:yes stop_codon:yes gene_type:complete